jgi:CubicO group peptidase (beta-lactamase class C family)
MHRLIALLLLLPCTRAVFAQAEIGALPQELESYVAAALHDWEVPGAAIAVVKDDQVVVAKGYGVRELGKPDAVDAETLFDIASLTKSFTAAMIASLVDEKKLAWDEPVRTYLPGLRFRDPYMTANVTLRDLLCHRTEIRNNSAWYFGRLSSAQLIELFAKLEPQAPFRTQWMYSNIGYQAAAEVAAASAGSTWEKLVTGRVLEPLRMTRSVANFDTAPALGNYAMPHAEIEGVQRAVPREVSRMSTAAAGGVQSSARDLATWMRFQLGDGTFAGRRILSAESMGEMHAPQIFVPTTAEFRTKRQLHFPIGYGFGWQIWDYRGTPLLWHSGSGDGESAYLALLPEHELGVVVLINSWQPGGSAFNLALTSRILDYYLGAPARDYLAEYRETWNRVRQEDADERKALDAARLKKIKPTLPLASYAGTYRDELGLDVSVTLAGDELVLRYAAGQKATLEHWHGDTFRTRWENPLVAQERAAFVSFRVDEHGKAAGLHMELFREPIDAAVVKD